MQNTEQKKLGIGTCFTQCNNSPSDSAADRWSRVDCRSTIVAINVLDNMVAIMDSNEITSHYSSLKSNQWI